MIKDEGERVFQPDLGNERGVVEVANCLEGAAAVETEQEAIVAVAVVIVEA